MDLLAGLVLGFLGIKEVQFPGLNLTVDTGRNRLG